MSYDFLQEISEARIFKRPASLEGMQISNLADNFFSAAVALQIMRYENPHGAKSYAQKTISTGLDGWRTSGSDLNNMAQVLLNQDRYKDRIVSNRFVTVPKLQLLNWLRNIAKGKHDPSYDRKFFLAMQRQLKVKSPSLITARRFASDWTRILPDERKTTILRVHTMLRNELGASDISTMFNRTAGKKGSTVDVKGKPGSIPTWAKITGAAVGGYFAGKKLGGF